MTHNRSDSITEQVSHLHPSREFRKRVGWSPNVTMVVSHRQWTIASSKWHGVESLLGYGIPICEKTSPIAFSPLTVMCCLKLGNSCTTAKLHYRAGGWGTAGGNPDGTKMSYKCNNCGSSQPQAFTHSTHKTRGQFEGNKSKRHHKSITPRLYCYCKCELTHLAT